MKHTIIKERRNGVKEYYNGNSWTRDRNKAYIIPKNINMWKLFEKIKVKKCEYKWIGFWE